jgi:ATP/maltotriose-dependent transcriptional regulator MalT
MVMARVLLADSQPLFNEALEALFSRDRTPDSPLSRLSPRERQVLALLSKGCSMELELTPGGAGGDH